MGGKREGEVKGWEEGGRGRGMRGRMAGHGDGRKEGGQGDGKKEGGGGVVGWEVRGRDRDMIRMKAG